MNNVEPSVATQQVRVEPHVIILRHNRGVDMESDIYPGFVSMPDPPIAEQRQRRTGDVRYNPDTGEFSTWDGQGWRVVHIASTSDSVTDVIDIGQTEPDRQEQLRDLLEDRVMVVHPLQLDIAARMDAVPLIEIINKETYNMNAFSGVTKCTTIDYPGHLACVLYAGGCCCRCPYCHNKELVAPSKPVLGINKDHIYRFLQRRQGKLTGVVLSGGEPMFLDSDFLMGTVRAADGYGYAIKLDTCGMAGTLNSLGSAVRYLSFIAIDLKAPVYKYSLFINGTGEHHRELSDSAINDMLINLTYNVDYVIENVGSPGYALKDYEFRTTVHKRLLSFGDLKRLKEDWLNHPKVDLKKWYLQQFHKADMFDPSLCDEETYSNEELTEMAAELGCSVRGV